VVEQSTIDREIEGSNTARSSSAPREMVEKIMKLNYCSFLVVLYKRFAIIIA